MRLLTGSEDVEARSFLFAAGEVALSATCVRARCGTVIVNDGVVVGRGFNSPPKSLESQRRCSQPKSALHRKVTDKTCCVHAEQRAVFDALKNNPEAVPGSRLYFARIDDEGVVSSAGKPYCTACSKLALDAGVAEFVLWHEEGVVVYDTEEYHLLSYQYTD